MRILAAAILLASIPAVLAQPVQPRLYAVIFEVTADSSGKIDTLKVSKVIDPASGTADAVDVSVPQGYLKAARVQFVKRTYKAKEHFFTYSYYDPAQPARADIDPKAQQR